MIIILVFYDFEVFKYDWLVVLIEPFNEKTTVIVNDPAKLESYHWEHQDDVWVGYNSRNYDQYILKAILLGFDPHDVNDFIIKKKRKGWEYSSLFNTIQLYNYDCMNRYFGLKQLESFMGSNIKETSVPFDIDRKLTEKELEETVEYCIHDVEETMKVFLANKSDFDAHLNILKTFDLPINYIGKTQAQLSAIALGCNKKEHFDEWEISFVDTLRIEKYKHVVEWFEKQKELKSYDNKLITDVAGIPHRFGFGGLHGAPNHPVHLKGLIIHVDVNSFYPSIMIRYDLLSRNVADKAVFKRIYDYRLELKKEGKKKEQAPYKIILNSTFGICKDPFNPAYDPRRANEVTVNGQLLLLDLIEHLEHHCELIQSNTDGLIIRISDTDKAFEKIDDICFEWETRTGMGLGFDFISEIYQKDVNNYLWIDADGKVEAKGAWLKNLSDLDYDLAIVNEAMREYLIHKTPIEETISNCHDSRKFQKVVKVSDKYICGWHNNKRLNDKTFRVFASKNDVDSYIGKVKLKGDKEVIEKFANTPEKCFIWNDETDKLDSNLIDKNYYMELAKKRLNDYGVTI